MIEEVKNEVYELLKDDKSGHGMEHINRVCDLSIKFANEEKADIEMVSLIALLHDVDDYKLFGEENAKHLTNARNIMDKVGVSKEVQEKVLSAIHSLGYSKAVFGRRPESLEGKIVSDADMCDAVGVNGIIRTFQYSMKFNKPFFDRQKFPKDSLNDTKIVKTAADTSVCHLFEKILKLKNMMLTSAGKQEVEKRHNATVNILYQLFDEENAVEWKEYLDNFLKENYK
jgi:uncharacterized protein